MTHNAASGKGRSLVKAKGGSSPQTTRQPGPFLSRGAQIRLGCCIVWPHLSYRQIGYRSAAQAKGLGLVSEGLCGPERFAGRRREQGW